jgi:tetratricopeptide (TPR) repeat protein
MTPIGPIGPIGRIGPIAVAAAALVVYLNALGGAFVWDDLYLIVNNPGIKSWAGAPRLFVSDLFSHVASNYFRPLQALSYLVDYQVWGLNAFGYHLTSVLLHALAALLVFRLGARLLGDPYAAAIGALLFAVHPVHTEAVAYVAGRSDPLAAVFVLASLVLLLRSAAPFDRWHLASALAFGGALLARETAIAAPLLIGLVDRFRPAPPARAGTAARYGPYGLVLAAYGLLRQAAVGGAGAEPATAVLALGWRVLTTMKVVVQYLALLVVPHDLHMERLVVPATSIADPAALGATACVAALVAVAVAPRGAAWPLACGVAWFLLALLPVSNVVPLATFMAEHWLYVPSIGLFLAAGWGLARLAQRGWRQPVATAVVIALAAYGGRTLRRNADWRDPLALYQATVAAAPHSVRAWTNLGYAHQDRGDLAQARAAYDEALRRQPAAADVIQNLGVLDAEHGRAAAAQAAYARAIALDAGLADPHNNLGNLYRAQGQLDAAVREFEQALALNPTHVAAHNNLALTYAALGRADEALRLLETALRIDPDSAVTHSNLGNFYFHRDDLGRAAQEYAAALRLNPDYAEAHNNLGSVYVRTGRLDLAEQAYRTALRLNPALDDVRRNLEILQRQRATPAPTAGP